MWLIRLNKLTTREYNLIARVMKKIGFTPRRVPPIIFIKSLLFHSLQKKSWRTISRELGCNYIALYNFYSQYGKSKEIQQIFHTFAERRIIVYTANTGTFTQDDLDNKDIFLKLTKDELKSIL